MSRQIVRLGLVLVVLAVLGVLGLYQLKPPARLPAVPPEFTTRAVIRGIPGARYFVTADLDPFVRDVVAARQREEAAQAAAGHPGELGSFDFLAVSGGGDNGAF